MAPITIYTSSPTGAEGPEVELRQATWWHVPRAGSV